MANWFLAKSSANTVGEKKFFQQMILEQLDSNKGKKWLRELISHQKKLFWDGP